MPRGVLMRLPLCLFAIWVNPACTVAQVDTGNLLVNPGAELGETPFWSLDLIGPTVIRNGPLTLPNGVAILATEGTHWFGADISFSKPAGSSGFISGNTA